MFYNCIIRYQFTNIYSFNLTVYFSLSYPNPIMVGKKDKKPKTKGITSQIQKVFKIFYIKKKSPQLFLIPD